MKLPISIAFFAACWLSAASLPVSAQTVTTLYNFCTPPGCTDGSNPGSAPIQAENGEIHGTTASSGAHGQGTVFKISTAGMLTTLHSFCSEPNCADGDFPIAGLIQAAGHDFLGTTTGLGGRGAGTVFKMTPAGVLTTLHSFVTSDGAVPTAAPVQAGGSAFYGSTSEGGSNASASCFMGCGTLYKITASGKFTTLHSFCAESNCADGMAPQSGLMLAADGNLYGTTTGGAIHGICGGSGCGTVFKITPAGILTTIYSFSGFNDGSQPYAELMQATDGNFYGTTTGLSLGKGTIFRMTTDGTLTTLYTFNGNDGGIPRARLIQATDGNFYGTTSAGGANGNPVCDPRGGCGTVFKITPDGVLTTLYNFCSQTSCADGATPYGGLIQATDGMLYGMTSTGGAGANCSSNGMPRCGTIFRVSLGLPAFVVVQAATGTVGAAVKIWGNNLNGADSVTFNGTPADFTQLSKTELTTTVPPGATTGYVEVITRHGTFKSSLVLTIAP